MRIIRHHMLLSLCTAVTLAAAPLLAADADTTTPPVATETTTACTDGAVWNEDQNACIAPEEMTPSEDALPEEEEEESRRIDDLLYEAAREFAYAGQHENALRALAAARNQDDPRILNYLGYNHRKLGRMELGMRYYEKALQADENHILARSYMGQALIEQGDIDGARVQLVEIRDRGGEDSWAYRALLESLGGERTAY